MTMFQYFDEDGNFIIESGSEAVPVFKVSGSTTYISGSLIPGDPVNSASAELGSETYPWKELYVESASINFIDTSKAVGDSRRKIRFSRKDVEDLKSGKSLSEGGHISASGDMHVVGNSLFRGETVVDGRIRLKGETQVTGALLVDGAADFRGHFRVNGNRIEEGELNVLSGLTATTDELNKLDGFTGGNTDLNYAKDLRATGFTSHAISQSLTYITASGITPADLSYAKDLRATGVTSTEFDRLDGVTSAIQTQLNNKIPGTYVDEVNPRRTFLSRGHLVVSGSVVEVGADGTSWTRFRNQAEATALDARVGTKFYSEVIAFNQTVPVTMSRIPNGTPGQKISIMVNDRWTSIRGWNYDDTARPVEGNFDLCGQKQIPPCFGTAIHTFEYNNAGMQLANMWKLVNSKYHQFPGRLVRGSWRPGGWEFGRNASAPAVFPGANLYNTANTSATNVTTIVSGSTGQEITVIVRDSNTTFRHGGAQAVNDLTMPAERHLECGAKDVVKFVYDGLFWYCTSYSRNSS